MRAVSGTNIPVRECCLCGEISSGLIALDYRGAYGVDSRICHQNAEFLVIPTVSPLCAGHVLIVPRSHVTCLSALTGYARKILVETVKLIRSRLEGRFGSQFYFFEHGTRASGMACGIDHAHLHLIPLPIRTSEALDIQIQSDFAIQATDSLNAILSAAAQIAGQAYLLAGSSLDAIHISFDDHIPSQYMRRLIAEKQSRPSWDWRLLEGRSEFRDTYEALK
jgi:diadenosine tetraphosphate (Ap4A) HIT family hydrolase